MNNQLDDFFRNKLKDHAVEPSLSSWTRVRNGLTKKNKIGAWPFAAAAMLLLGLGIGFWMYTRYDAQSNNDLAETQKADIAVEDEIGLSDIQEKGSEPTLPVREKTSRPTISNKSLHEKQVASREKRNEPIEPAEAIKMEPLLLADNPGIKPATEQTLPEDQKPIVIVVELKAIARREDDRLEAGYPERKSGLKKVLEVANDFRTGDNPLGGLRQAKEDIFALNFRKEEKNNK